MELTNQTNNSLGKQWIATLEETLDLSKAIVSGSANVAMIEMGLSIPQTLSKPTIRTVFKGHDQIAYSVVNILVNRFMDSFGFSTKLSGAQLETLTVDTLENFAYESLEDIILFFKMARTGKFGSTKKGVDSNLIYGEWYPAYLELKADERERQHQKEKSEMAKGVITSDDVHKAYQQAAQRTMPQRVAAYVDKITKDITRDQLEEMIVEWGNDQQKKPYLDILKRKRLEIKN